jgi:hypothetical protein
MNVEEDIKKLENIMQNNIETLSEKIVDYNKKLKQFNLDGKPLYKTKIKFNLTLVLFSFVLVYIIIYFILLKTNPDFINDKVKNKETFFIENNLSNIKHISYSFLFTIFTLVAIYLIYYFYNFRSS